jgi:hypothetical protein
MSAATLADRILRLSSARIQRQQLNLAATVIMLQHGGYNAFLGYEGVRRRRFTIDHRFVSALLKATNDHRIIRSPAFTSLSRSAYRRLFFKYWRLRRKNESWRLALAWSLGPFLVDAPQDGAIYSEPIWALAMDPDEWIASRGLQVTQYLGNALTVEQCKALIAFAHHESARSGSSMSALGSLYKNIKKLRPEVRALLLDPAIMATLRSANPHDGRGKNSSHGWCVANMRKALARARRGRGPQTLSSCIE